MNLILGGLNAALVYMIGSKYYSEKVGTYSGLLYGVFPVAAIFDVLALQDTVAISFMLSSILLLGERPFATGCLLALAGQSRTELSPFH
jgi:4-amino-4-deoxy-L-arabinose transferase-like glycosyltransferase